MMRYLVALRFLAVIVAFELWVYVQEESSPWMRMTKQQWQVKTPVASSSSSSSFGGKDNTLLWQQGEETNEEVSDKTLVAVPPRRENVTTSRLQMIMDNPSLEERASAPSPSSTNIKTTNTTHDIPPLSKIVQHKQIIGSPQRLFDFVIAGFAKCGTTSLLSWLQTHTEICMPKAELNLLRLQPRRQIHRLHQIATRCVGVVASSSSSSSTTTNNTMIVG